MSNLKWQWLDFQLTFKLAKKKKDKAFCAVESVVVVNLRIQILLDQWLVL